jgi:cyanophycin synthetase
MLDQTTRDINTNVFIHAAKHLKLDVEIISAPYSYCLISDGHKKLYVYHNWTSLTDIVSRRVNHNKFLSQRIFKNNGVPVPDSKVFDPEDKGGIVEYIKANIPIVVKPVKGSRSVGVTVNPQTDNEINAAIRLVGKQDVMVEKFIKGDPYRILMYDRSVLDVLKWSPPYIIGDGEHSLQELVAEKNKYLKKNKLKPFVMDDSYLAANHIDVNAVLQNGNQVFVRYIYDEVLGGEAVRMDMKAIHPDNLELFARAGEVSGLLLAGLDFISEDLSVSYKDNEAAVNEINSAPHMWPHYFAEQKEDPSAIEAILEHYFLKRG